MPRVAVIPGDGIGHEVSAEGVRVLRHLDARDGLGLDFEELDYGAERYLRTGVTITPAEMDGLRGYDAILFGALGDPRVESSVHAKDILLGMRFQLDLYINLRPCRLLDARYCPLKGKGPEDVDMVIVRENTEGAYSGMHGFMHKGQALEVSTQTMTYTRQGTERAIRYAFELAMSRNKRKQVTLIDKANAIRAHDLWTRTFREVAEDFPEVKTEHAYIDAACMWMVKNPEWFDVAVTPNLLGDIITDLGAMVQGGMGLAASGNIHPGRVSLFEPIHGSAPKHAGKNVASPVAAIMACSMMLDYLGEKTAATAIESVLRELFRSGRLCGAGTGDHPTNEVGDLVAGELRQPASSV